MLIWNYLVGLIDWFIPAAVKAKRSERASLKTSSSRTSSALRYQSPYFLISAIRIPGLVVKCSNGLGIVSAGQTKLRQEALNLMSNAAK